VENAVNVSAYIALLESVGARFGTRYLTLKVMGDVLPVEAMTALARYAPAVVAFLKSGIDGPLPDVWSDIELTSKGFGRIATGAMVFPDGDDAGDRVLAGIERLTPSRQRALDQRSVSRSLPLTLTPASAASGHYTYSRARGQQYDNLPFEIFQE
jgi:hypothetical protein